MKSILSVFFLLYSLVVFSQIDANDFSVISITGGIKSTSHYGYYVKSSITPTSAGNPFANYNDYTLVKEKGNVFTPEFRLMGSSDNGLMSINLDGVIYLVGIIAEGKNSNYPDRFKPGKFDVLFSTPSPQIQSVNAANDISRDKRFWCFNFVDVNATFGDKAVTWGFDLGWKAIGFTYPGTSFNDTSNTYSYHDSGPGGDRGFRFYIGPSMGIRKNISEKICFTSFLGVNYLPNIFADEKFKRQMVNPYINLNLFLGADKGVTLQLAYHFLKGKTEFTALDYSGPSSVSHRVTSDLIVNQLEIKAGFYLSK